MKGVQSHRGYERLLMGFLNGNPFGISDGNDMSSGANRDGSCISPSHFIRSMSSLIRQITFA
jgi:hypothetical protein